MRAIYQIKAPVIIVFLMVVSSLASVSQCNPEQFAGECIGSLSASGFNFLKSYKVAVEEKKNKIEYSYVLTKGTQYMIDLCPSGVSNDVVVSLFDSNRNQVATSKVNGQMISKLIYPCNATMIYYIQFTSSNSKSMCCGSALGFKR